jgi:DNA repair protein RadD
MLPRPYQEELVGSAVKALNEHSNTLAVAPTGSGKTLMIAWLLQQLGGRQLILQHREELVNQNQEKFHRIVGMDRTSSVYGLGIKDPSGDTIFGMAQTLGRNGAMKALPPFDSLVVDEAHHVPAESYQRIIEAAKDKNPDCLVTGFTATAARGDKKGLRPVFDNVCAHITLRQLVSLGFLVPPKTYIASITGIAEEIQKVRKTAGGEYDMDQVGILMNTRATNDTVVREWKDKAHDRKTIVFCSTIKHAQDVCGTFASHGIRADCVFGDTVDRASILERFDKGDLQVLANVAVLTEGYDSQPVSCIILLRPCSFKSTMLQMIGRGLRTVNPEEYPGVIKRDCLVLDFGESLKAHGSLELAPQLDDAESLDALTKLCPNCGGEIPMASMQCFLCGYEYPQRAKGDGTPEDGREVADVVLTEVDIMNASPFKWMDLFGSGKVMVASGFNAWVTTCSMDGDTWVALGKQKGIKDMRMLAKGDKGPSMAAADDFLRTTEDPGAARKSKRWLNDPATAKQLQLLERVGWSASRDFGLQKYKASCLLNFLWARETVERKLYGY